MRILIILVLIFNCGFLSFLPFLMSFFSSYFNRSPNSNNSPSHLSIPDADYVDASGDLDDFEELPVLGKAKALYSFEAQSEGAISMDEGEELEVVELDQGDGWTRVRRTKTPDDTVDEGFVPTSYLDIELDANTT